MTNHQLTSIARLESERRASMLSEETLRSIVSDPGTPDEIRESTQAELESCRKQVAELTKKISLLEQQIS